MSYIKRLFKLTLIGHKTLSDVELLALHTVEEAERIGAAAKKFGFTNVHIVLADKVVLKVPVQEKKGSSDDEL
jgi:hypothetical protein